MADASVIIVGGGIIGLSTAFEMAQRQSHAGITVLERNRVGSGTTSKATGGIRTQFSSETNVRLALLSRERFAHWQGIYGGNPRFVRIGYLFVTASERQAALLQAGAREQRRWGVEVSMLTPPELARTVPGMATGDLRVGTFTESDGMADPGAATAALESACRRAGVTLREGAEVQSVRIGTDGAATGVILKDGTPLSADRVVVACGPWTAPLLATIGLSVPIRPHHRQVYRTGPLPAWPPTIPLTVDLDTGLYCHSDGGAVVFGGGDRDTSPSFDDGARPSDVVRLGDALIKRWPRLGEAPITHTWAGLREMTPDDHGVVGELPDHPGLFVAAGFSGHGFMQAPAVGLIMAALATGSPSPVDASALHPGRFLRNEDRRDTAERYVF
ncbi:MAG: FAD-binding oxidoreductase [Thermaerobacter sp.]|nr:FAD-binding oxidoreductase [Thermaerobacter sp.]